MTLQELNPRFLQRSVQDGKIYHNEVSSLSDAQGVIFLCPLCFVTNNGSIGTHSIICWGKDKGIPDDAEPKPGRWEMNGTGLADLTLSPSILLKATCGWHGFIQKGMVTQ